MSTFHVAVCEIASVTKHPGADKLDLVTLKGMDWQVVTAKNNFKIGDLALYFPIDSLLTEELEAKIFGSDSKVKLHNHRVKTIKLRGAISQGLIVPPKSILDLDDLKSHMKEVGADWTGLLGVKKYETPIKANTNVAHQKTSKRHTNPNFKKYGGIENAKNYSNIFEEGEEVVVTEKCHGSHIRCGWVLFYPDTLFKRVKLWLGLAPKYEFVYGSNNIQLQSKLLYSGYYEKNVYAEAVKNYNLKEILKPGQVIHGEIYGPNIQKGYGYDCKENENKAIFFDLKQDDNYLNFIEFEKWTKQNNLPTVPRLYTGPFNKEKILKLRDGNSVICPKQSVREGIVVKPVVEQKCYIGRKLLKFISDEYLLKNQDAEVTDN